MDPNSGRLYSEAEYDALPPERQVELVRMEGREEDIRKISESLAELRGLRPEAKTLARSGHPAARAEGERALVEIEENVRALRRMLRAVE